MATKVNSPNSSFSTFIFLASLLPSAFVAININVYFNQIVISFLLIFLLITLWLSLFITGVVSLYRDGQFTWGNIDTNSINHEIRFYLLALIFARLFVLSIHMIPAKYLKNSKKNIVSSTLLALIIPTISIVPYIFIIWIFLLFSNIV